MTSRCTTRKAADAIGVVMVAGRDDVGPGTRAGRAAPPGIWAKDVRTPLGLVDEGDGRVTVFYTGFEQPPDWTRLLQGHGRETCAIGYMWRGGSTVGLV